MSFVGAETGEALRAERATGTSILTRPLRICLVAPVSAEANGGTAAYIRYLGTNLRKQGHEVRGVARLRTEVKRSLQYELTDAGANTNFVEHEGWRTQLIAPNEAYRPLLKNVLKMLPRPALEGTAIRTFQNAYRASLERAIPHEVDVVHYTGTGYELLSYAALSVARRRGAAFTITPFVHPGEWGDSPVDARLYNQVDIVCACSGYEQSHLESKGVNPALFRRIGVAPAVTASGDRARFRARHNLGDRPLILFLARKQNYKGYHALCRAMAEVVKAVPDVCLVAAGPDVEPPYPAIPEGALLDLGELTPGPEDAQHKADALAGCDVFCMPSTAEAFGIVYVEAWANGMPVIAGSAPAVQELVENGVNGYRVTHDSAEIAEALIPLLQDPAMRERMGRAGREKQQTYFTWESVSDRHIEVFREALLRSGRSPEQGA